MRSAKVKDLRRMANCGKDDAAQEIGLMAHLSGMVAEDFDELDAVDYRKLQESFRACSGLSQREPWDGMARWFRFQPSEIDALTVEEFVSWLDAASEQISSARGG